MLRFISLALCAATLASVALAGDGKPCDPKPGKAPCKAGAKPAGKKAGKPCDKKDPKAKELAGGACDAKKAGKCDGKGVDKPVAKKPADAPCEKKKDAEPCEKREGRDGKPEGKGESKS